MKKLLKSAFILALTTLTLTAWANDPEKGCGNGEDGQTLTQLLDNQSLRLWEIELSPEQFANVHAHPGQNAYAATDGVLEITTPEGKTETIQVKAGDLIWTEATTYKTVNAGSKGFKAIVYEDKAEQIQPSKNFYSFSK